VVLISIKCTLLKTLFETISLDCPFKSDPRAGSLDKRAYLIQGMKEIKNAQQM
jgi:hypothetical protein